MQKIKSNKSNTCSSNLTHFLPIRLEFIFFTMGGCKGFIYPCWDIVHGRWSSIFEKWDGTISQLSFGGCFTKHLVFGTWKIENGFLCAGRENFLCQHCSSFQDTHVCTLWTHYHKLCLDSSQTIGRLTWKSWNLEHGSSFLRTLFQNIRDIWSLLFFLDNMSSKMNKCEGFRFFKLVMSISKHGQNWRSDLSRLGFESCKTINGSMIKQHILNLKLIFAKNKEQQIKYV